MIKAYFDKKARLSALRQQQNAQQASLRSMAGLGLTIAASAPPPPPQSDKPIDVAYFAADAPAAGSQPSARKARSPAPDPRPPHNMSRYLSIRDIDWTLLIIVLLICVVGVLQIFSATLDTGFHGAWWKQIVYVAGGLLLMWMAIRVDYHSMLHYVPILYLFHCAVCWLTCGGGHRDRVQRWIPLPGGFHFQVSEFVKLVIILLVARYLTDLKKDDLEVREMLKLAGLVVIPTALVSEATGPGNGAHVCGCPGRGSVSGGIALEVYRRHSCCGGGGASGGLRFF